MDYFCFAFWETVFHASYFFFFFFMSGKQEHTYAFVLDYLFKDVSTANNTERGSLEQRAGMLTTCIQNW